MKNLQQIVDAYIQMDQQRRDEAVVRMVRIAKTHPNPTQVRRTPKLSLVVDNTSGSVRSSELLSRGHNLGAVI